jgi:hypothetical protein
MSKAKEIITNRKRLLAEIEAGKYKLRLGRPFVGASDIAAQHYCEKSVELAYIHGKVETQDMESGTKGHEAITVMALPTTHEDAVRKSFRARKHPYRVFNFAVHGIFKGVPILGRPDEVWFRQGAVELVVEDKFSSTLYPYMHYRVQGQLYCLLLEEMGYDASDTQYKVRTFKLECRDCERLILHSCPIFNPDCNYYECEAGEVKAFLYPYNRADIESDLEWALGFWLEEREAVPTSRVAKCVKCEYRVYCDPRILQYTKKQKP